MRRKLCFGVGLTLLLVPLLASNLLGQNLGKAAVYNNAAGTTQTPSGVFFDVSQFSGGLDAQLNACNAVVLILGGGTCDARALGGQWPAAGSATTYTLASEVPIASLPMPTLTQSSGGSLANGTYRVVVTYINAVNGQNTAASIENSMPLTGSNGTITVTSPSTYSGQITSSLSAFYTVWMTAVGGGSWTEKSCGATNLGTNTVVTSSSTCAGAAVSKQGESVTLLVPPGGTWQCSITDTTSSCLDAFDGAQLIGESSGVTNAQFSVVPTNTATSVYALVSTDRTGGRGVGEVVTIKGVRAKNSIGAVMTNSKQASMVWGPNLVDVSVLENSGGSTTSTVNLPNGSAVWIRGSCCQGRVIGLQVQGGVGADGSGGGTPLVIGGDISTAPVRGLEVSVSAVNPGFGDNAVSILDYVQGLKLTEYTEMNKGASCDTSTPALSITGQHDSGIVVNNIVVGGMSGCSGVTSYAVDINSSVGTGTVVIGSALQFNSTNIINDHISGRTIVSAATGQATGLYVAGNAVPAGYALPLLTPQLAVTSADFTTTSTAVPPTAVVTGLSLQLPPYATNWAFDCYWLYSESASNKQVNFGVQTASHASTNLAAWGHADVTTSSYANAPAVHGVSSTSAQTVIQATPTAALNTPLQGEMHGTVEGASTSGTGALLQFTDSIATGTTLTVYRGAECYVHQ